jgi:hypothetical protein
MSAATHLIGNHRYFITAYLQGFRDTGNLLLLLKALALIMRQGRTHELAYGLYCVLAHRPSPVCPEPGHRDLISGWTRKSPVWAEGVLARERLVELYGEKFKVGELPLDFQGARREGIWQDQGCLVIGEYGEDCRIVYVTADLCTPNEYYRRVPGVRHIHAVEKFGDTDQFLVATGDRHKFLDLWSLADGSLRFERRITRHLAGFTAAIRINGEYYFGTDFSGRPNWIETLDRKRFFFPRKAYKLHVTDFFGLLDRYILSLNTELLVVGGRKTLSIFDTVTQRFIYCDDWVPEPEEPLDRAA